MAAPVCPGEEYCQDSAHDQPVVIFELTHQGIDWWLIVKQAEAVGVVGWLTEAGRANIYVAHHLQSALPARVPVVGQTALASRAQIK
jgi:hypothetical protein